MAYCYECGSEVAPNDAFCPYCGISLQPIGALDETAENASEKSDTEKSDAKKRANVAGADAAGETAFSVDDNSSARDEMMIDAGAAADAADDRTIDSAIASDTDEWSLEGELAETQNKDAKTGENLGANESPIPEINIAEKQSPEAAPAPPSNESLEDADDSVLEEQISVSAETSGGFSDERTEPHQTVNKIADESESVLNDRSPAEPTAVAASKKEPPIDDFDEYDLTLPGTPSLLQEQDRLMSASDEEKAESAPKVDFPVPEINQGIAKPADDLDSFEVQQAPSIFDSVRIMENKVSEKPERASSDDVAGASAAEEKISGQSSTDRPASTVSPDEAGRSYTTPNIGGSDTDGKRAAKLKPLDEGTVLNGRYEIIRKIGGGGMGAVYLASDNNLGGVLRAVKEMVQSYIEEEQQDKAMNDFRRESVILSTLDHAAIPTIYDYFYDEKEGRFYLVMKYISGGDLSSRLRAAPEGRIDEKTVTEWGIQIADVLDYLHNRPTTIVYRDLKPANVMIDGNSGRIMLIDFGIARSVNKEEKGVTAVGTMGYAPPELFSGNVEPRSDIYSLGSTMFHLLTGADPQSNPLLIFDFQKNPRPRQINPQLSDQIERILMRSVEYNAHARFASAAEMRRELEAHLEKLKSGKVSFGIAETPASVSLESQPVFCGFCGQKIVATDLFCAFCGSKQPIAQQGVHSEIYAAAAPPTARLMIVGTSELESPIFNLEKDENLLGRRDPTSNIFPEVDLSKFDPQTKISRRHARIWRDGSTYMVEDLGSSNGTLVIPSVDGTIRLLPHQPHVLTGGDKIRLGDTTLHFVVK